MLDWIIITSDQLRVDRHCEPTVGCQLLLGDRQRVNEVEVVLLQDRVEDCSVLYIHRKGSFVDFCGGWIIAWNRGLAFCVGLEADSDVWNCHTIESELASVAVVCPSCGCEE